MCTFMSTLPRKSKTVAVKKNNLPMYLKPCPDDNGKKTWYRVRLLAFTSPEKNDRDYPFIERFVHQVWKKNEEKGFNFVDDEITCPVTKHVHWEGNRYDDCPICKLSGQYYGSYNSSGKSDKNALKKSRELGRKYQAIVPVYVVDDPNYQANKNNVKVIIFNDKKIYADFKAKVEKASQTNCVFNGKNAVDCCIHVSAQQTVVNEGQPNQYVFTQKVIDKIVFSKDPYDIPSITSELVNNCGFDEEYYTSSTPAELQAFYDKYYKISNDDIPDEDDVEVYDSAEKSQIATPAPVVENVKAPDVPDDLDDLLDDSDDKNTSEKVEQPVQTKDTATDDIDADDLLSGLDL